MPRTQNPPESRVKKAEWWESWERSRWPYYIPITLAVVALFFLLIILAVVLSLNPPTSPDRALLRFSVVVFFLSFPTFLAGCAVYLIYTRLRWIFQFARDWAAIYREPYLLDSVRHTFEPRLKANDTVKIEISLFLMPKFNVQKITDRIFTEIQSSLLRHLSELSQPPTIKEINGIIDSTLDLIGEELQMPIYFAHVVDFSSSRGKPTPRLI